MAKAKSHRHLSDRLHAGGLRSRTAKLIPGVTDGRRKPSKRVDAIVKEMRKLLEEVEDRITRGPAKRRTTAKKGAKSRKIAKRSARTKKGARTKAKSGS